MKSRDMQFALREIWRTFKMRTSWGILIGVITFLAMSGPFGTIQTLGLPARTLYWAIIVLATFTSGASIFIWLNYVKTDQPSTGLKTPLLGGVVNGIVATIIILFMNWAALGIWPFVAQQIILMSVYGIGMSVIIFMVMRLFVSEDKKQRKQQSHKQPTLLKRLDMGKRGALISLTVQDHYVEVTTNKGTSLILMRLKDAIGETNPIIGHQIHRSHWVATEYIKESRRQGDKAFVALADGRELPISRTYLKPLREAGVIQL